MTPALDIMIKSWNSVTELYLDLTKLVGCGVMMIPIMRYAAGPKYYLPYQITSVGGPNPPPLTKLIGKEDMWLWWSRLRQINFVSRPWCWWDGGVKYHLRLLPELVS